MNPTHLHKDFSFGHLQLNLPTQGTSGWPRLFSSLYLLHWLEQGYFNWIHANIMDQLVLTRFLHFISVVFPAQWSLMMATLLCLFLLLPSSYVLYLDFSYQLISIITDLVIYLTITAEYIPHVNPYSGPDLGNFIGAHFYPTGATFTEWPSSGLHPPTSTLHLSFACS
jgi:hypothetical protein